MQDKAALVQKIQSLREQEGRIQREIKELMAALGEITFEEARSPLFAEIGPVSDVLSSKKVSIDPQKGRVKHGEILRVVQDALQMTDVLGAMSAKEISKYLYEKIGKTPSRSSVHQALNRLSQKGVVRSVEEKGERKWEWVEAEK